MRGLCFSAPHVARRIACLSLRFTVGVVSVFVELLRLCQSFDIVCPQRGRSLSVSGFFNICRTVGVSLHVEKERDFLEGAVYLSTKKFLRGEICGGNIGGRANAGLRFISVECSFSVH